ncbi:hypothetical protein [Xanthovirga aplysinae]|uniref:hypothetical protein n=1 Tax=Xanthovirga aplysinae TaxID=2529853 RepID=UPI0012BC1FCA|nr:hypothetical protein [Xanthovirga aplysinae]MTI31882.1 hypothetical protein [Xanthovirga aplysinae]
MDHLRKSSGLKAERKQLLVNLFFLFNSVGLPGPLLYTNLIFPFYIKILRQRKYLRFFIGYAAFTLIYGVVHFLQIPEINWFFYLKTSFFLLLVFLNILLIHHFLEKHQRDMGQMMEKMVRLSFTLFLISIVLIPTPLGKEFWKLFNYWNLDSPLFRYMGLSYEPSYYAGIMTPALLYFSLKVIKLGFQFKHLKILLLVLIPWGCTLSLGVFGALFLALVIGLIIDSLKRKTVDRQVLLGLGSLFLIMGLVLSIDTTFSNRIKDVLKGRDTSGNGRTYEAFYLAYKLTQEGTPSLWTGIGLGQVKIKGEKVIRPYYGYADSWTRVDLPNCTAETFAVWGLLGFFLRIALQIVCFIYFKVASNYFQLFLFLFLFIYQFTGSFVTSTAEYMIWLLIFMRLFPEFDIPSKKGRIPYSKPLKFQNSP